MKIAFSIILSVLGLLIQGCTSNSSDKAQTDTGQAVDSAVVGKDTTSVDVRRDIDLSDDQKQVLPGRDTTNSDEPK
ncbi:hypothetical protein MUK70_10185 [Dyadobacter chenwenxiniae]|uniref:Uncharacterized protein n=1 Tax=Dyadobacter chenwenxiniae TaxID=2906456 RepID=A0A9X1TEK0_9BACT|nr:hypothetical protein [Dyadobacter chenwenxiniae]MCF0052617.1 hypothetical protein [Dyadobacter chenwenxiniae]MCF0063266.1 hypothetical protein [Dyadobacter chenwenxiniae]UON85354.1 hypothetical protein MUK70_10185 [Dyadobacter chenwenxiniae]